MSAEPDFVPNFSGSQGNLCLGGAIVRLLPLIMTKHEIRPQAPPGASGAHGTPQPVLSFYEHVRATVGLDDTATVRDKLLPLVQREFDFVAAELAEFPRATEAVVGRTLEHALRRELEVIQAKRSPRNPAGMFVGLCDSTDEVGLHHHVKTLVLELRERLSGTAA